MLKKDNFRFGLLIGLLVPLLGTFIYYLVQFRNRVSIREFYVYWLPNETYLLTAMMSILIVVNIGIFTYYINSRKDRTAKGVFAATCLYGLASLLWKLFY